MKINIVKPLLLSAASSLLLACGGGSGGSEDAVAEALSTQEGPATPKYTNGTAITELNYVASASTFYNTALITATATAVVNEINLSLIRTSAKVTMVRDCSISGETTTVVARIPFHEKVVHNGDSIEMRDSDCKDAFGTQSGTQKTVVKTVEGSFASGEYVISTDVSRNITQTGRRNDEDNGQYKYQLPIVYGLTNNEDIQLIGINLSVLDASVAPNTYFPNVETNEKERASASALPTSPTPFSTPAALFNTFAFELITNNTTNDEQTSIRWKFNVTNKEDADSSYSTQTTRQLIFEERYVDESEEEDGDNLEIFALQGKFNFKMATGEIIYVEIFSPDAGVTPGTPIPSNVVVSYDNYGDGVIDAKTEMSWEEFTVAMFSFYAF